MMCIGMGYVFHNMFFINKKETIFLSRQIYKMVEQMV